MQCALVHEAHQQCFIHGRRSRHTYSPAIVIAEKLRNGEINLERITSIKRIGRTTKVISSSCEGIGYQGQERSFQKEFRN